MLAAEEHATEVDVDQPAEVVDGVLLELHAEARGGDAHVVVQDVECAEGVDRRCDHGDDVVLLRHVGRERNRGAACGLHEFDGLLGAAGVEVGAENLCALLGEPQGGCPTDA